MVRQTLEDGKSVAAKICEFDKSFASLLLCVENF